MFANIGWLEISIVFVVLLVLFGGSRLPKVARSLGHSGKELKKASNDLKDAVKEVRQKEA